MSGKAGPRDLHREIREALADEGLKAAVANATGSVNANRRAVIARFPGYEEARDRARSIQERAIASLPDYIDRFTRAVETNGGHVHVADDAEEACRVITTIAKDHGARRVAKSKSMTSEEIHLNSALEAAGIHVRETDLGEYIIQLSGDRPSHIIAPIIHLGVEDVREVFRTSFRMKDVPREPAELTQLARERLRSDFLAADLGITGANFLLADTGTAVIVENEGNARMSTQLPPVHIVLAGVDKLLPAAADLLPFLQLLPRTATGQLLTSYLSFISGPGWASSPLRNGRDRAFHVVLLDNGRLAMRDDPLLVEALYCIRCGGCMTVCPPYQVVGGHVYGGPTYQSGIGNAWEAGVSGLQTAAEFNELCTTCSRCEDVCPVRIDIPWMNTVLRERIAELDAAPPGFLERRLFQPMFPSAETASVSLARRLFANPARAYHLARKKPWKSILGWPPARALFLRLAGLTSERGMPEPAAEPLAAWNRRRGGRNAATTHEAQHLSDDRRGSTVVLFADCHTDNVDTEVGRAAITCLEKCGLKVVLVAGHCCGRAAMSQGMLRTARRQAESLLEVLDPLISTGHRLIGIEPSCLGAIVDDYVKLMPGSEVARKAATGCSEITEFLARQLRGEGVADAGAPAWKSSPEPGRLPLVLHGHCQQKTLGWMPAAVELLSSIPGAELRTTNAECCGMAGSFGYKAAHYGISRELGQRLSDEIETLSGTLTSGKGKSASSDGCRFLACGTSCRAQIRQFAGARARHPVELIAERLG